MRDRWAFYLHRKLAGEFIVLREWKRRDLAILDNLGPKALVELKAMYTFDAAWNYESSDRFIKAMKDDELKARELAEELTEIYTVLLTTHPNSIVPEEFDHIIKYRSGINRAIKKFGSSDAVKEVAIKTIDNKFEFNNVIKSGSLNGGEAFGINVDVLFWIVKA